MLTKNIQIYSLSIFAALFFVACNHSKKQTSTSPEKSAKSEISGKHIYKINLKTILTQNSLKQPVSELSAYISTQRKPEFYTDAYKRKWKISKDGTVVIPSKLTYAMLMPPSYETLALDAAVASRLYNDKYLLTSTRQFVSILEMPHPLDLHTKKIKKSADAFFCKKWSKIEKSGGKWDLMLKKVGLTSHKETGKFIFFNHINKFRFSMNDYHPVFMRMPFPEVSITGFALDKQGKSHLLIVSFNENSKHTLEQILKVPRLTWEDLGNNIEKAQFPYKNKIVPIFKTELNLDGNKIYLMVSGKDNPESFLNKIKSTISIFKTFPVCPKS